MKSNHGAPLEHGTVYLMAPKYAQNNDTELDYSAIDKYNNNSIFKNTNRRSICLCNNKFLRVLLRMVGYQI